MITEKEVKEMAFASLIYNLHQARNDAKTAGFGWEFDDDISTLLEQAEHAYQDEIDSHE